MWVKKIICRGSRFPTSQYLTSSRCGFAEDAKMFTKIHNACAQLLYCSLNHLFRDVPIAAAVSEIFLNSILYVQGNSSAIFGTCEIINKIEKLILSNSYGRERKSRQKSVEKEKLSWPYRYFHLLLVRTQLSHDWQIEKRNYCIHESSPVPELFFLPASV